MMSAEKEEITVDVNGLLSEQMSRQNSTERERIVMKIQEDRTPRRRLNTGVERREVGSLPIMS